jgi:5-methylcytosine-specific restriction endonuclease McrA
MNRWGIPDWLEREVTARDKRCVYCGVAFCSSATSRARATWEHIVNDARIVTRENIARCCASCNASKGTKHLADWFTSAYCQRRGITSETVSDVVRRALAKRPWVHVNGV